MMNKSREVILNRIRGALKAPRPHRHPGPSTSLPSPTPADSGFRAWLPAVGPDFSSWVENFRARSADLKTEFHVVPDAAQASRVLSETARLAGWKRLACHQHPDVARALEHVPVPRFETDAGYAVADLESCDAGVTACDALVAQTGTVVLTSATGGGRALSVLPHHHVVIARAEQLVPDLPEAYALLRRTHGAAYPSLITLITGPSRTGDIERILVLGAHGPKRLTVFLIAPPA